MEVLQYTKKDVALIRKHFQVTEAAIKENIAILKKWIGQQKHLPKNQDDDFLERQLLRSDFKIEEAKKKLEQYYTIRKIHKEYYEKDYENIVPTRQNGMFLPLPLLTPESERIILYRLESDDPEVYDLEKILKFMVLMFEILIRKDYSIGDRFIVDCEKFSINHVPKVTASIVSNFSTLYMKVYSARPKTFDFINCSPCMNSVMETVKLTFLEELNSVVKIHDNLASFYENYPKECLPSDYGGKLESFKKLTEKWDVVFEKNQQLFKACYEDIHQEDLKMQVQPEKIALKT